jgi:hypothetical protein
MAFFFFSYQRQALQIPSSSSTRPGRVGGITQLLQ